MTGILRRYQKGGKVIDTSRFWVIAVVSNPRRFETRYRLFRKFHEYVSGFTPNVIVVESAFGERDFEITTDNYVKHVRLRTFEEVWHKENMINLGIQRIGQIDPRWEYVAWIDGDIEFVNRDWVSETVHQLQHYQVVQMFQNAVDLGPKNETFETYKSFMSIYLKGLSYGSEYSYAHPGYAWAARREAIEMLGGVYDQSIIGSGDYLMARSFIGSAGDIWGKNYSHGLRKSVIDWQSRCTRLLHRDVGFVPGTILHYWHGKKKNRKYLERNDILVKSQFDPFVDIKKDSQGLWQLDMDGSDRMIRLRDDLRIYASQRNEDDVVLED